MNRMTLVHAGGKCCPTIILIRAKQVARVCCVVCFNSVLRIAGPDRSLCHRECAHCTEVLLTACSWALFHCAGVFAAVWGLHWSASAVPLCQNLPYRPNTDSRKDSSLYGFKAVPIGVISWLVALLGALRISLGALYVLLPCWGFSWWSSAWSCAALTCDIMRVVIAAMGGASLSSTWAWQIIIAASLVYR
jgi:hypothetical protein